MYKPVRLRPQRPLLRGTPSKVGLRKWAGRTIPLGSGCRLGKVYPACFGRHAGPLAGYALPVQRPAHLPFWLVQGRIMPAPF